MDLIAAVVKPECVKGLMVALTWSFSAGDDVWRLPATSEKSITGEEISGRERRYGPKENRLREPKGEGEGGREKRGKSKLFLRHIALICPPAAKENDVPLFFFLLLLLFLFFLARGPSWHRTQLEPDCEQV